MSWAYKGEEDWKDVMKKSSSMAVDDDDDDDEDFFAKKRKGKRGMAAIPRLAKKRATEFVPVQITDGGVVDTPLPQAAPAEQKALDSMADIIELDSDSDDESLDEMLRRAAPPIATVTGMRANTALNKIRERKALLKQAQGTVSAADFVSPTVPRKKQGNVIEVTLRAIQDGAPQDLKLSTKLSSPFSTVIEVYCNLNSLEPADVKLKFDGIPISPDGTPGELNMRDGDVVDVFVSEIARVAAEPPPVAVDPSVITLKVRNPEGQVKKFRTKKTEPLKLLFEAYARYMGVSRDKIKFKFDGEVMSDAATPEDDDMESDDIIDAVVKK